MRYRESIYLNSLLNLICPSLSFRTTCLLLVCGLFLHYLYFLLILMPSNRSLVTHIYDALPNDIPATWDDPPDHVEADFSAVTQGECAMSGLLTAKNMIITEPGQLVGRLQLSEAVQRLRMSDIFDDSIFLGRLPKKKELLLK